MVPLSKDNLKKHTGISRNFRDFVTLPVCIGWIKSVRIYSLPAFLFFKMVS